MPFVRIVRSGLLMLIPVLTVGSAALILRSLPISVYQSFITTFGGGFLYSVFSFVYNATFGLLSVYMVFFLSYCTADQKKSGDKLAGPVSAGVASFLISVGFLTGSFQISSFSAVGMFTAIICGTAAPALFIFLKSKLKFRKLFLDGSEPMYNRAISALIPLAAVLLLFTVINLMISMIFSVSNFWELFSEAVNALFGAVGLNFFGGLLYILISSVLWFFGIHGSDVLESVTSHLMDPAMDMNVAAAAAGGAPSQIYTKTFFDVFVLMGGCGAALSLLVALLLFSRRKSSRSLAKMAAAPMLFNINELMVFGLPIVYNPTMLIPFIAAPLACFLISTAAMKLGLVPIPAVAVEWTTPIILGGYQSTGSVWGSVLQVVNLGVGTVIYMPFIKRYDRMREAESRANIGLLTERFKEIEKNNDNALLTEESGITGSIAKQLVHDLMTAMEEEELFMLYQPQCNSMGACIGAEALLRWAHPTFGTVYPPMVIRIAEEGGYLTELEKYVFRRVKADMKKLGLPIRISINVTAQTIRSAAFADFLTETFPDGHEGGARVCIEITEQSELITSSSVTNMLDNIGKRGFALAIDDFSMGFTSLKYLQECRFDEVKLDGSLVRGMTEGTTARDIISSIVYLSGSLGFSVLAEYVETPEQKEMLGAIGCSKYQGYLFSCPIAPEELKKYCAAVGIAE